MSKHKSPEDRRTEILDAALELAERKGLGVFTRLELATQAGVANGLLNKYFGTMAQLHRAVMRAAVQRENLPVLAQGLARRDPQALKASDELRNRAIDALRG